MANQTKKTTEASNNISELNLFQRLAKIRQMANVIQTNKKGYGYKYVSDDEIMAHISAGMKRYQVSLIPHISPDTTEVSLHQFVRTKATENGDIYDSTSTEIVVKSDGFFRWICDDDPTSYYDVPWVFIGQQTDASQAFGSGLTYCNRYFLLKFFNVSTVDDDPDNWRTKQKEAAEQENRDIASSVAQEITEEINKYKNSVSKEDVEKFRGELATFFKDRITVNGKKSTNYLAVTDPVVLSSVLGELREFINNKSKEKKEKE